MKRILIIGATSGIGRALALHLATENYRIVISGRRTDRLEEIRQQFPDRIQTLVCDVTNLDTARNHIQEAATRLGGLDIVVVNAGVGNRNPHHDWEPDKMVIETNIAGFAACAHEALTLFKTQGFGHLIGISSVAGRTSFARSAAYNASKAFVSNYLRGLRLRTLRWNMNIHVTDVRPGFIESEMTAGLKGMFWIISADKAALLLQKVIEKPKKVVYIPGRWALIGMILPLIPDWLLRKIH